MTPPPGPYAGTSTLALVARVSAFSVGVVYGSIKLKYLKKFLFNLVDVVKELVKNLLVAKAKSHKKAESTAHH